MNGFDLDERHSPDVQNVKSWPGQFSGREEGRRERGTMGTAADGVKKLWAWKRAVENLPPTLWVELEALRLGLNPKETFMELKYKKYWWHKNSLA